VAGKLATLFLSIVFIKVMCYSYYMEASGDV